MGTSYSVLFMLAIAIFLQSCNGDEQNGKRIDRNLGLFPHSVGNLWIKEEIEDCAGDYKMEVVSLVKSDTADFFEVKHWKAPCKGNPGYTFKRWYAEDLNGRIYVVVGNFEYACIYVDMSMNIGDRFERMGLMDYVVAKDETSITTEYDNYEDFKASATTFVLGLGMNPGSWSEITIDNEVFIKGIDY